MKRLLPTLCAVVFAATASLAADASGIWKVDGEVYANPVKFSCELKQDGATLSGKATFEDGKNVPVTGSVKEKTVAFEFDAEHEGTTYHLVFDGTLGEDGGMKGTITVAGAQGTFTATK
jgi:hypothetical protein